MADCLLWISWTCVWKHCYCSNQPLCVSLARKTAEKIKEILKSNGETSEPWMVTLKTTAADVNLAEICE